jgi:hypothetical protein
VNLMAQTQTQAEYIASLLQADRQERATMQEQSRIYGYEIISPDTARMAEESVRKHEAERYL